MHIQRVALPSVALSLALLASACGPLNPGRPAAALGEAVAKIAPFVPLAYQYLPVVGR